MGMGETRKRTALGSSDIELIEHIARVYSEHQAPELIAQVFEIPDGGRRELLELLVKLDEVRDCGTESRFRKWSTIGDALHDWARRWGRRRSLADAFIMRRDAWRAVHMQQAGEP